MPPLDCLILFVALRKEAADIMAFESSVVDVLMFDLRLVNVRGFEGADEGGGGGGGGFITSPIS